MTTNHLSFNKQWVKNALRPKTFNVLQQLGTLVDNTSNHTRGFFDFVQEKQIHNQ